MNKGCKKFKIMSSAALAEVCSLLSAILVCPFKGFFGYSQPKFMPCTRKIKDGKKTEPSKNEQNQKPGLPRTKQNAKVNNVQEPEPNDPYPVKNRTEREPECHGSTLDSFTE